ncbi:MAG: RNA polymerase sigma factor [Prevotellaceae bacterium]|nr:RNA polymerase sigma factor [Prevotellaceae bacterium]
MNNIEFEYIANAVRPRLIAICHRFLSATGGVTEPEDIVQETMLRLWKMGEHLDSVDDYTALAVMIAKNICIDHYRRQHSRIEPVEGVEITSTESSDHRIIAGDTARLIDRAIGRLPVTQRRMLLMRSEGMSLDEIAEACGATRASVKTMISAARRKMLEQLEGRKGQ